MRVRLVTACGAERFEDVDSSAHTVIVPMAAATVGTADDFRYYKPREQRMQEEAALIRRRYFQWRGEYDHCGLRLFRERVE